MKEGMRKITLAIGDGANDVPMIRVNDTSLLDTYRDTQSDDFHPPTTHHPATFNKTET